jgi:hypothetical protein
MLDYAPIKEFVKKNPEAPAKDVAKKFGCTLQNVYTARHAAGVSKPLTMTKKKRLKVVRKSTLDDHIAEIRSLREQLKVSDSATKTDDGKDWKAEYDLAVLHIKKIERLLAERQVVIGYLEHQLFSRANDGATV